jgi:hypothetical protein
MTSDLFVLNTGRSGVALRALIITAESVELVESVEPFEAVLPR